MADTKITQLQPPQLGYPVVPATDVLPIVVIADPGMATSGSTRKVTVNQLLGAGGTATLASATITGDLTVDTNVLKVDTTNNVVGIGTASPTAIAGYTSLTINTPTTGSFIDLNVASVNKTRLLGTSSNFNIETAGTIPITMMIGGQNQYRIDTAGVFTWYDGAGGTRMTLNSTGLGVGTSPSYQLHVLKSQSSQTAIYVDNQQNNAAASSALTLSAYGGLWNLSVPHSATFVNPLIFKFGSTEMMRIDSSGNVGVGVTPSAWGINNKALQVGANSGAISSSGSGNTASRFSHGCYFDGTNWLYSVSSVGAARYEITGANAGSSHAWYTSAGGTAGNTITDFASPKMTLDASGNLLVGKTATNSGTVGVEIQPNGNVWATKSASTSAATAWDTYSTGASAYRFYVGMDGTVHATNTTISAISDARLKENVQDIDVGLGAILALKPRKFDWKAGKGKDIKGDRGFIAQEFEQVFPNLIDEWKDPAPEGEAPYKSVRQDLIPVLVKAIQELTARVQTLETR